MTRDNLICAVLFTVGFGKAICLSALSWLLPQTGWETLSAAAGGLVGCSSSVARETGAGKSWGAEPGHYVF